MKILLSVCIPTLNRPELLLNAIKSIAESEYLNNLAEICISNNHSDVSYEPVELLLSSKDPSSQIKYIKQTKRLGLDENHHFVKRMAVGQYIYFLGDDDFFLPGGFSKVVELVKNNKFDLAIFNGIIVNEEGQHIGRHFSLEPIIYSSVEDGFKNLKDKGSFGSVLANREILDDSNFSILYGTDHAYGCYWLSLFKKAEKGISIQILVPNFPAVALRSAKKSYNHLEVYFKNIPQWMIAHQKILSKSKYRYLIDENAAETAQINSSIRFLINLRSIGYDLHQIKKIDQDHYRRIRLKVLFAQNVLILKIYRFVRFAAKII